MKNAMMILAMCLIVCTSLSAQAPQGGQQRGPRGVNLDEIPGITAEQKQKIEKIQTDQREEMQKVFGQNRQAAQQLTETQRQERTKKMNELREAGLKEIEKVLTPEQFKVYKEKQEALQQQRQRRGPQARRAVPASRREYAVRRSVHSTTRMQAPRRMRNQAPAVECPCTVSPKAENVPA